MFSMSLGEKNNPELDMKHTKTTLSAGVKDKKINHFVLLKSMRTDAKRRMQKAQYLFENAASNLFSVAPFTLVVYVYTILLHKSQHDTQPYSDSTFKTGVL